MKPDAYKGNLGIGAVVHLSKSTHPLPEIDDEDIEPLFSAETRVEQLEEWLEDLEDSGLPAQCSTRVLLKVKDELGLLEDENKDDKDGDSQ